MLSYIILTWGRHLNGLTTSAVATGLHHLSSKCGVPIIEGCLFFCFVSLPLTITRPTRIWWAVFQLDLLTRNVCCCCCFSSYSHRYSWCNGCYQNTLPFTHKGSRLSWQEVKDMEHNKFPASTSITRKTRCIITWIITFKTRIPLCNSSLSLII